MGTVDLHISLPEELKAFVDARVAAGGYDSASAYLGELLRRDEEQAAEERFAALIQEGLDSPRSTRTWEEMREDWTARIAAARSVKSLPAQ